MTFLFIHLKLQPPPPFVPAIKGVCVCVSVEVVGGLCQIPTENTFF